MTSSTLKKMKGKLGSKSPVSPVISPLTTPTASVTDTPSVSPLLSPSASAPSPLKRIKVKLYHLKTSKVKYDIYTGTYFHPPQDPSPANWLILTVPQDSDEAWIWNIGLDDPTLTEQMNGEHVLSIPEITGESVVNIVPGYLSDPEIEHVVQVGTLKAEELGLLDETLRSETLKPGQSSQEWAVNVLRKMEDRGLLAKGLARTFEVRKECESLW